RSMRDSLKANGRAISQTVGGQIPSDTMTDRGDPNGVRVSEIERNVVTIDKPLTPSFTLCVKHPAAFTALLKTLRERFECFALVRNPLAVISSWNSVNIPLRQGHLPGAYGLDPVLKVLLDGTSDIHERQLKVLSWFFRQYAEL